MLKIFLSYRRDDSADAAGRLHDRLDTHFGQDAVFMDVDRIPFGVDFRKHLDEAVSQCDIRLAVIGEDWLQVRFEEGPRQGQRRLDDPGDYVRSRSSRRWCAAFRSFPCWSAGRECLRSRNCPTT